ncbi:FAD-dependent oxidoreductase [Nocardioides sp. YIM 152588]|uniref:FAD-dependent oxidoreductase n=1 Tax=Nocardioides sp. YIM 152588 TaxID=3158259 RepID=UPI0032E3AF28
MRIVVVGGDAAGMSAAHSALRQARAAGREVEVEVVEATGHTSYSACGIPYWIADDVEEGADLVARTAEEHRAAGIRLRLHTRATAIDPAGRTVTVEGADPEGATDTIRYDELVLATGARPVVPDWARGPDGALLDGVHPVKTLDDGALWRDLLARAETAAAAEGRPPRAVIVGGGYIGVEMAETLVRRRFSTTLVTRSRVMGRLDEDLGARVAEALALGGVDLRTDTAVDRLVSADGEVRGRVRGVVTTDGRHVPADVVVLALGVEPATDLGRAAGLPLGTEGGYLPDGAGRLAPGVWAAGDCCEQAHRITGHRTFLPLGTHANKQGRAVGAALLGGDLRFPGAVGTAITRFVAGGEHVEVARTGLGTEEAVEAGYDVASLVTEGTTASGYMPEAAPLAIKVLADRADRRLLGVQIVGGPGAGKRIDAAAAALWGSMSVDDLAWMDLSYAPPFATAWEVLQVAARRLAERL